MPVRFAVAPHAASPVATFTPLQKPQDFLNATWGRKSESSCAELLQTSLQAPATWPPTHIFNSLVLAPTVVDQFTFANDDNSTSTQYLPSVPQRSAPWDLSQLIPRSNGFVDTVIQAYNNHHHLIIRPDDVWLAILSQFNLYVNANAEDLRTYFVAHEGKKELAVSGFGNRYTADFGSLAKQMTDEIDKNILDKELKNWILPDFTTTTHTDTITSAVMMMSTLKAYFGYTMMFICGIPSVTLEGEKQDWEKLLARIDHLSVFGKEPKAWSAMLRPILTRFVQAFEGEPGVDFWNHVSDYQYRLSGCVEEKFLRGWITAFCVWNERGEWVGSRSVDDILLKVEELSKAGADAPPSIYSDGGQWKLEVDGIPYPTISVDDIPPGYCEVDVHLDDNGEQLDAMMVSGHMSMRVEGEANDVVRPHPAWFMFIKGQEKWGRG